MSGPRTGRAASDTVYHLSEWWKKGTDRAYLAGLLAPLRFRPRAVVLDVGCGSGYVSAYLSVERTARRNLAMDLKPQTLRLARELAVGCTRGPIEWICGRAEHLPVASGTVDHVVCRVALPYTDIPRAVAEISRALAPRGSVVLQLHSWRLYANKLSAHPRRWKRSVALLLILLVGVIFHFTGRLFRPRIWRWRIDETFQTLSRMRALLEQHGLSIYGAESQPEFVVYAVKSGRSKH